MGARSRIRQMQGCTAAGQQRHIQNMLPKICRSTQDQPDLYLLLHPVTIIISFIIIIMCYNYFL